MNKKLLVAGTTLALSSMAFGAYASDGLQAINANLNKNISIVFNGETQTLTDANGQELAPISYLGSTYVPIRAVSDIFGEDVNWDGNTQTIYLGKMEKQPVDLTTQITTGTDDSWKIVDASELTISGSDANETYASGIAYDAWIGVGSFGNNKGIELDVNGYSELTFTVYSEQAMEVIVGDENYETIYKFDLEPNTLVEKTISISGQDKIILGGESVTNSGRGIIKFLEPTAK